MHVALTRARQSLFVFGDMETLKVIAYFLMRNDLNCSLSLSNTAWYD